MLPARPAVVYNCLGALTAVSKKLFAAKIEVILLIVYEIRHYKLVRRYKGFSCVMII